MISDSQANIDVLAMLEDMELDEEFQEKDSLVPGYQRDTISSFTTRTITKSMPRTAYDERHKDSLIQTSKIPVPRVYKDPKDGTTKVLPHSRGDHARQRSVRTAMSRMNDQIDAGNSDHR